MSDQNFQSKYDLMREAAQNVKAKISLEKAKSIISEHGHADLLNQVKPEHYQAVIDECARVLAEGENELDVPSEFKAGDWTVPATSSKFVTGMGADFFHCCSAEMMDSAVDALNKLPEGATVEQAVNHIYNAWVKGGFIPRSV